MDERLEEVAGGGGGLPAWTGLAIFLLFCVVAVFVFPAKPGPDSRIPDKIREIEKLGGTVEKNQAGAVVAVHLSGRQISDDWLPGLQVFPVLEAVYVAQTGIGDNGVRSLSDIKSLKVLSLAKTRVTDDAAGHSQAMAKT